MSEQRKLYKRPKTKRPPNLTYKVELLDEAGDLVTLDVETLHPWRYEYEAMPDLLVGEVEDVADPTGKRLVKVSRLYMKHLLVKLEGIDPDELKDAGGDVKAVLDLPGNEELSYLLYGGFLKALAGAYTKSRTATAGAADGGSGGSPAGQDPGGPSLPGL